MRHFTALLFLFGFAQLVSANDSSLRLTSVGVGPISSKTKFDESEIQKLFPKLKIKRSVSSSEGEEFPVLQGYENDKLLFTIYPSAGSKNIFSVVTSNDDVKNALGPKIGSVFADVYKSPNLAKCDPGMEEMSGEVICSAPESSSVKYIFKGSWNGPDGEIPPANILRTWRITQIAWRP